MRLPQACSERQVSCARCDAELKHLGRECHELVGLISQACCSLAQLMQGITMKIGERSDSLRPQKVRLWMICNGCVA